MESTDKDDKTIAVTEESSNHGQNCEDEGDLSRKTEILNVEEAPSSSNVELNNESEVQIQEGDDDSEKGLNGQMNERTSSDVMECASSNEITKEILAEDKSEEPVFDGTEVPEIEETRSSSNQSVELDSEAQGSVLNDRAVAIKNFVKEKSAIAVSTFMRRLSGKKDENEFKPLFSSQSLHPQTLELLFTLILHTVSGNVQYVVHGLSHAGSSLL